MSSIVGVAEVLVRPNTTGFEAEATPGIVSAGTDLGKKLAKTIAAGFALGGVYEGIKSVVEAATQQNEAFTVLDQTIKNAGQSITGFTSDLGDKLEKQARATGVSAEDLAKAMSRLVPATGNVQKSFKDLNTAIGISETYHISLSTAALALAKAETGSFTSLQRYLGLIPRVTTNVDALKARYIALTEGSVHLDASQKAQYASALKVAQAHDDVLTSQNALASATQKFAGVSQTFANTYQGQFERLHVAVDQLKVAVGTELVSGLASASGKLSDFLDKLIESNKVQQQAKIAAHDVGEAFHVLGEVAKAVGPPLESVADRLGGVTKTAEALAGVFAASKIISYLGGLGAAETTVAAGQSASAAALTRLTAALDANTAAQVANASAVARSTVIYDAYGRTLTTVTLEQDVTSGGIARTGTIAEDNAAKVGVLRGALTRLATIGLIAIPIEILLNKKTIDNSVSNFLDEHGLPGGRNTLDAKQVVAQYSKIADTFGPTVANKLRDAAEGQISDAASKAGAKTGNAFAAGFDKSLSGQFDNAFSAGFFPQLSSKINANVDKATTSTKAKLSDAAKAMLQSLRDGISSDQTDLASIKQNLADAITQGAQAVTDAVNQAKQNLNTIGSSLSAEIQSILVKPITDAQRDIQNAQDKLSLTASKLTLRNLGREILLPGGHSLSTDPQKAIAQLQALEKKTGSPALTSFIQQYQSALLGEQSAGLTVSNDTLTGLSTKAGTQISNLTDLFNTGKIDRGQLGARLQTILKRLGITPAAAGRAFGISGSDTLSGLEQGLLQQAGAINAGPQRPGSGLVPSITRPLQTLEQTTKQISDLRRQEAAKQLDESKKHTKLLNTIAGERKAAKFTNSLAKNPGTASTAQKDLTGVTG